MIETIALTVYRCPDCGSTYSAGQYRGPRHAPETLSLQGWGLGCGVCGSCGPFEEDEDELAAE